MDRDDTVSGTIIVDLDEDFVIPAGKHSIVATAERRGCSIDAVAALKDKERPWNRFGAPCVFPASVRGWTSIAIMDVELDNDIVLPAGKHTIVALPYRDNHIINAATKLAEINGNDGSQSEETVTDDQNPAYTPCTDMSSASDVVSVADSPANSQNYVPIADIAAIVESFNNFAYPPLCWKALVGKLTSCLEVTRGSSGRSDYTHAEFLIQSFLRPSLKQTLNGNGSTRLSPA